MHKINSFAFTEASFLKVIQITEQGSMYTFKEVERQRNEVAPLPQKVYYTRDGSIILPMQKRQLLAATFFKTSTSKP